MAGGLVDQNSKHLSSTEILHSLMTGQWRTLEGKLPEAVMGLRGATLNNQIFMTGKYLCKNHNSSSKTVDFRVFWRGRQKIVGPLGLPGGVRQKKHLEIIFHAFLGKVNEYGGPRTN